MTSGSEKIDSEGKPCFAGLWDIQKLQEGSSGGLREGMCRAGNRPESRLARWLHSHLEP